MKREDRIRAYQVKHKDRPRFINISDLAKEEREAIKWSSARRFIKLNSPDAIEIITQATKLFQKKYGLEVTVTSSAHDDPEIPQNARFGYGWSYDNLKLHEYLKENRKGGQYTIALVCEEDLLIAYGIAERREAMSIILIIDVEKFSRRSADFKEAVEISGENFEVGVGHVLALALIRACPKPIKVDADNSESQYIFYSLGFHYDDEAVSDYMTME